MVYLDLSHKPHDFLESRLGGILEIYEKFLGAEQVEVAESLNNLAAITYSQRRLVDAERLARQAVSRARRVWGDEHPETASQLNNLGLFLLEQGDVEDRVLAPRSYQGLDRGLQAHLERIFALAAVEGQQAMGLDVGQALLELVIVAVFVL